MVIGSVTKTFVAAAVLELVDEGRLSLDDSVRRFLPDVSQVSREITIRQLLDHTSGLAEGGVGCLSFVSNANNFCRSPQASRDDESRL